MQLECRRTSAGRRRKADDKTEISNVVLVAGGQKQEQSAQPPEFATERVDIPSARLRLDLVGAKTNCHA